MLPIESQNCIVMNPRRKYMNSKSVWLTSLLAGVVYGGLALAATASDTPQRIHQTRHRQNTRLVTPSGGSYRDGKVRRTPDYEPPRSPGWHDDFGS
jgi:hypothetical protein